MEIVAGWTHTAFPLDDASRVGQVRRHAVQLASGFGWSDVELGRLALIVTELGTNLFRHARAGRLLIAARPDKREVEVIAIDEGPGIPDLPRSMRDGFSTGGTAGTGLGAIQRLASDFDIYSSVPHGTVCVARVRKQSSMPASPKEAGPLVQVGAICLPAPGETVCGDAWAAALDGRRAGLMLADGLGHGPEAAKASHAAIAVFMQDPFQNLSKSLEQAHVELQGTRGAAACNLLLDGDSVEYVGAGNILGRVMSGVADRSLVTQHGTVGMQTPRLREAKLDLPQHAIVILYSDGINSRWDTQRLLPLLDRDPTLIAAVLLRDHTRHRDDATIVVLRRKD